MVMHLALFLIVGASGATQRRLDTAVPAWQMTLKAKGSGARGAAQGGGSRLKDCWHVGRSTTATQCLQAKGASMAFTQLMIRAETGRFAGHSPVAWVHTDLRSNGVEPSSLNCHEPDLRVLVLRDPFERLLSGYDMMAREALAPMHRRLPKAALPLLGIIGPQEGRRKTPTPAQFARFVLQTADYTSRTPSWPVRMLSHLMPFTSLWHRQQQNCALQPPESFDMVLRLEEQPRWLLHLSASAQPDAGGNGSEVEPEARRGARLLVGPARSELFRGPPVLGLRA